MPPAGWHIRYHNDAVILEPTGVGIPATISFTETTQNYDGEQQAVAVTTVPAGLAYSVTYDGDLALPTQAGSYVVEVVITEPGYAGTDTTTFVIEAATPVITWQDPAAILSTTPLGAEQLNAVSSVAGTFTYSAAVGSTLPAGTHTLTVNFVPDDNHNYDTVTDVAVSIAVFEQWTERRVTLRWQRHAGDVLTEVTAEQDDAVLYEADGTTHVIGSVERALDLIVTAFEPNNG